MEGEDFRSALCFPQMHEESLEQEHRRSVGVMAAIAGCRYRGGYRGEQDGRRAGAPGRGEGGQLRREAELNMLDAGSHVPTFPDDTA